MIFEEGQNTALWEEIRTGRAYGNIRAELRAWYEKYCLTDMKTLPYSVFMQYRTVGNRVNYEHLYFDHRARLAVSFLNYMIHRSEEYRQTLVDTVWGICDEYTWCLSAHIRDYSKLDSEERCRIDLFAAETGFALAEIKALAPEAFDDTVKERIHRELSERIKEPYLKNDYYWEHWAENWNAVCTGSVAMCMMYEFPELCPGFEKRWLDAMEVFLTEFGGDGCCSEGTSYWGYGFGYFVYFAAAYRQFTDGRVDFFRREIVEKTARFQQNMSLATGRSVGFADCEDYLACYSGLTAFLCREYASVTPPCAPITVLNYEHNETFSLAPLVRNLVWKMPDKAASAPEFCYYCDAQWYIKNSALYSFAAKCGNNDEAHNHNDVGSFILQTGAGKIVIDMGSGVYDKSYFSPDGRYKIINCSSLGHSVPIVRGAPQHEGAEYRGEVLAAEDGCFYMDISGAYEPECSVKRRFELEEDKITLADSFSGEICDRIMLADMPERTADGAFLLGDVEICVDAGDVKLSPVEYFTHNGRKQHCCAMDITAKDGCEVIFKIKRER